MRKSTGSDSKIDKKHIPTHPSLHQYTGEGGDDREIQYFTIHNLLQL